MGRSWGLDVWVGWRRVHPQFYSCLFRRVVSGGVEMTSMEARRRLWLVWPPRMRCANGADDGGRYSSLPSCFDKACTHVLAAKSSLYASTEVMIPLSQAADLHPTPSLAQTLTRTRPSSPPPSPPPSHRHGTIIGDATRCCPSRARASSRGGGGAVAAATASVVATAAAADATPPPSL